MDETNTFLRYYFTDKPYLMLGNPITIHHYYFAEKTGNLLGILPNTSTVINIPGPFISFDKVKRLLKTGEVTVYLPEGKAEKSKNPPLAQNTLTKLKSLIV
jgi:hypothetical protein